METPNLLDLPFEVLDLIFKNLYDRDKWQLAKVNNHLGKAFAYHIRDKYERVSIQGGSWWFITAILPLCASSVRHIEVEKSIDTYLNLEQLIENYLGNLQSLTIDIPSRHINSLKRFLSSGTKLQSIEIHVRIDYKNFPKMIGTLKRHPRFKSLNLYNISRGLDRHIQPFSNLEVLKLEFSPLHDTTNIFELCVRLERLRNLKIMSTEIHSSMDMQESQALEMVEIKSCIISAPALPYFKSLKRIRFEENFRYDTEIAFKWILQHSNTLESLTTDIQNIQADIFFKLIKSCQKLRYLNLKVEIVNLITKEFITTFLDIMQKNGIASNNPFIFVTKMETHRAIKAIMPGTHSSKLLDFYTI